MDDTGNRNLAAIDLAIGPPCSLCGGVDVFLFTTDRTRSYFQCKNCGLVFVAPSEFLTEQSEKLVYDQHQNNPQDVHYRQFLNRLCAPLVERLPPNGRGLDFGSGPGPTLSHMLMEKGHSMAIYDHFYAPDPTVWNAEYDFITATEVVEHLHRPGTELERLWAHIKPSGSLGIMTKMVRDVDAFAKWHYKNDPTHVCFFSVHTFTWLAHQWSARFDFFGDDVVIFTKNTIAKIG